MASVQQERSSFPILYIVFILYNVLISLFSILLIFNSLFFEFENKDSVMFYFTLSTFLFFFFSSFCFVIMFDYLLIKLISKIKKGNYKSYLEKFIEYIKTKKESF